MLNIKDIRNDFPILSLSVYGKPLVYLDNGATTQKPRAVVDAITNEYYNVNANVHRGVHFLSQKATELHEQARETIRTFIHAKSTSNIVPWQMAAQRRGIRLKVIPINDKGELLLDEYRKLFTERTRIVSVTHVSNVLGTVNPVKEMVSIAHEHGVPVLIDGAQSAPHIPIDVQDLDCDFFAFSGHKIYGPTGIGVLYGKEEWLDRLPPYQGGGEMIQHVSFEKTTFNELPYKFEAGTPDYVGSHALAVAIDYVSALGMDNIHQYERQLTDYAMSKLQQIEGMRIYGTADDKDAVISFLVGNIHHLDMGTLLDRLGIAVRTGHHCAEPLMHRLGIEGTVRASLAFYNTREEIDILADGIQRLKQMF